MKRRCKRCKGLGVVQIAPYVKGVLTCPYCKGVGIVQNAAKKEETENEKENN